MRRKYLYFILAWSFVFAVYSFLLYMDSNTNSNQKKKHFNSGNEIEKKQDSISIKIPGIGKRNEKTTIFLKENMQQSGIYERVINLLLQRKKKNIRFPNKIKLNEAFIVDGENGIVVDFNNEMLESFPGGTGAEFEFLNGISKSVFSVSTLLNSESNEFKELKWIYFLSSGDVSQTISGHIDIEKPFYNKSNIINPFVNLRELTDEPVETQRQIQRIVIDPGHGGENKGVTYKDELTEKKITLIIGKALKRRLIDTFGIDTILTRNIDKNISLDSRASKANNQKSGLFISIHVNYSFYSYKRGAKTYINSISSVKHSKITVNENKQPSKSVNNNKELSSGDIKVEELQEWHRTQDVYVAESYKLAKFIQTELNGICSTPDRTVNQLPIRLLSSVSMPAVLIEVGFVSNVGDRDKLKSTIYLNRITNAIFRGVSIYINSKTNL